VVLHKDKVPVYFYYSYWLISEKSERQCVVNHFSTAVVQATRSRY
jgi:hypothetical protein